MAGSEAEGDSGLVKLKTLLPVCALLASVAAQAADDDEQWVELARDSEAGVVSSYDARSVRTEGDYRQVWARDRYNDQHRDVREVRALYEVDCAEPAIRLVQSLTFLRSGRVQEVEGVDSWKNIIDWGRDYDPSGALHRAVCRAQVR